MNHNGRPSKKELWKQKIAYGVTKLTEENVRKLGEAFAIGATVEESCDYADISPSTYYLWCDKNPELSEYFDRMRQKLPLKAKANIAGKIHNANAETGDITLSRWLVERNQPDSYGDILRIKDDRTPGNSTPDEDKLAIDALHKTLRDNRIKRSLERAKAEGEIP